MKEGGRRLGDGERDLKRLTINLEDGENGCKSRNEVGLKKLEKAGGQILP